MHLHTYAHSFRESYYGMKFLIYSEMKVWIEFVKFYIKCDHCCFISCNQASYDFWNFCFR